MSPEFDPWPELRLSEWKPTYQTLHRWTQVPGKVCLALSPLQNHYWQVAFRVTARGLATAPIPLGDSTFDFRFDFVEHSLTVETSTGARRVMPLVARSVADFYGELRAVLSALKIDVHLWEMPVEIADPVAFPDDREHDSYDPELANRFFRVLTQADQALKLFSGHYLGKQSPSHFFWGSFDLAQTRFSGRRAPPRPGADRLTRECYSHEVLSFGFWPGTEGICDASFYAYAAPEPPGFNEATVSPIAAGYSQRLSEFLLPYEEVRRSASPRERILEFCQSVYERGATLGGWDRTALERPARAEPPSSHPPA